MNTLLCDEHRGFCRLRIKRSLQAFPVLVTKILDSRDHPLLPESLRRAVSLPQLYLVMFSPASTPELIPASSLNVRYSSFQPFLLITLFSAALKLPLPSRYKPKLNPKSSLY